MTTQDALEHVQTLGKVSIAASMVMSTMEVVSTIAPKDASAGIQVLVAATLLRSARERLMAAGNVLDNAMEGKQNAGS